MTPPTTDDRIVPVALLEQAAELIEASMAYSVRPCAETSEALLELMSASPPEAVVAALRDAAKGVG